MNPVDPEHVDPQAGRDIPSVSYSLACTREAIRTIDELARSALQELRLDPALGTRLRLIVEEMLTNVIMHGEPPADGTVILVMRRTDDTTLVLDWTDPGKPFDPRSDLPRDTRQLMLEDRRVGGVGWPLILGYCRIQGYARSDGVNRLTLSMAV